MLSTPDILAIQDIKDSVERPRLSGWLSSLGHTQSMLYMAGRFHEGALKMMNILQDELPAEYVHEFQRLDEVVQSYPMSWPEDRHRAAKRLWKYVSTLDEWLARKRIHSPSRAFTFQDMMSPKSTDKHSSPSSQHSWLSSPAWLYTPVAVPAVYSGWYTTYLPFTTSLPWSPARYQ